VREYRLPRPFYLHVEVFEESLDQHAATIAPASCPKEYGSGRFRTPSGHDRTRLRRFCKCPWRAPSP
jgi:hypothetical protein